MPGDGLGVTPGGAQDIGFAREQIDAGLVPPSEVFMVEGLLSEHDLPVAGGPCESVLCVRPATARAERLSTGEDALWVQLGMTSGVSPDAFRRPPLDLSVVIDRSSTMSIDMDETENAVLGLIDQLGPEDRLEVLAFNDRTRELHPFGPVEDAVTLKAAVKALTAAGSMDIEGAVARAYRTLTNLPPDETRLRRVVVLSCGYPWVEADRTDRFSTLVEAGAERRVALSYYGVLLGFDRNLADLLGETHGGVFGYLEDLEKVEAVFIEDFDLGVTPVGYDLNLSVTTADGVVLAGSHGVPGATEAGEVSLSVSSLFFSQRKGAVVLRLAAPEGTGALGEVRLSYTVEPALGLPPSEPQVLTLTRPAPGAPFQTEGVRKTVALVNLAESLATACGEWHEGDRPAARSRVEAVRAHLAGEADALGDAGLRDELSMVDSLLKNMTSQN